MIKPKIIIPKFPLIIGILGLFPYLIFILIIQLNLKIDQLNLIEYVKYYTVLILNFLSGFLWIFPMTLNISTKTKNFFYIWGAFITGVCWTCILIEPTTALLILNMFFLIQFYIEFKLLPKRSPTDWYIYLRLLLTIGIVFCIFFIVLIS